MKSSSNSRKKREKNNNDSFQPRYGEYYLWMYNSLNLQAEGLQLISVDIVLILWRQKGVQLTTSNVYLIKRPASVQNKFSVIPCCEGSECSTLQLCSTLQIDTFKILLTLDRLASIIHSACKPVVSHLPATGWRWGFENSTLCSALCRPAKRTALSTALCCIWCKRVYYWFCSLQLNTRVFIVTHKNSPS